MFIAALFTIAKTLKKPKCPSTNEGIKGAYIYPVEYYSAIKTNLGHLQQHGCSLAALSEYVKKGKMYTI